MDEKEYIDVPEGLNLLCRAERPTTGSAIVYKVPKTVTPSQFPDWCVDNIPLGFAPVDIAFATDEQCEVMGY
tara:strand:- start:619 stop:834 length:216 start_codon:yes stop_codon:yes gene_type:complete